MTGVPRPASAAPQSLKTPAARRAARACVCAGHGLRGKGGGRAHVDTAGPPATSACVGPVLRRRVGGVHCHAAGSPAARAYVPALTGAVQQCGLRPASAAPWARL
eukprot:366433-Chlamydomonas_euryale.AAC.17